MRKGCFPLVPIILCFWNISLGQLSCCLLKYVASAFPKEYATLLKGTILDSLAPLFPLKHHLSSMPTHLSTWPFWYRDVFCSFLLGGPDYVCKHCASVFWYQERVVSLSSHAQQRIVYHSCCSGGRVSLPKHKPFPQPLCDLVKFDGGRASKNSMKLIRQYNSMFAFTSLGVDIDKTINTGRGPYIFWINGVVHHHIGSLIPNEGNRPQSTHLYIYNMPSHPLYITTCCWYLCPITVGSAAAYPSKNGFFCVLQHLARLTMR